VHHSAKDYLLEATPTRETSTWLSSFDVDKEHSALAFECLACIENKMLETAAALKKNTAGYPRRITHSDEARSWQAMERRREEILRWQGILFYASNFWHAHLHGVANHAEQAKVLARHPKIFRDDSLYAKNG